MAFSDSAAGTAAGTPDGCPNDGYAKDGTSGIVPPRVNTPSDSSRCVSWTKLSFMKSKMRARFSFRMEPSLAYKDCGWTVCVCVCFSTVGLLCFWAAVLCLCASVPCNLFFFLSRPVHCEATQESWSPCQYYYNPLWIEAYARSWLLRPWQIYNKFLLRPSNISTFWRHLHSALSTPHNTPHNTPHSTKYSSYLLETSFTVLWLPP